MSNFTTEVLSKTAQIATPARMIQLRPTRLLVLPTGTKREEPSFAMFLSAENGEEVVVAQLSLRMFLESLNVTTFNYLRAEIAKVIK